MLRGLTASAFLAVVALTAPVRAAAGETCDALVSQDGGPVQEITLPNYSIIERTADPNFAIVPAPGGKLHAFVCDRTDIVPAENDWKVLHAGYDLHIRAQGLEGVLEMSDGRPRYHLLDRARYPSGGASRTNARLDAFAAAIAAAPKPTPPPPPAPPAAPAPAEPSAPAEAAPPPPPAEAAPPPPPPGQ